jgi:predicted metal-dependent peptidase
MTTPTISVGAKQQIIKILREQGYPRYAKLVSLFDIYLTDDPGVIGYMIPGKAKIVLNEGLNIYQVSVIVRHEVLHEFFTHHERQTAFDADHKDLGSDHEVANIAADYEISNRGYTQDDKANVRSIKLNGKVLSGLVTEDHYPEWKGLSFEEMYEKLLKEKQANEEALKDLLDQLKKISGKALEDLEDLLDKMSDAADGNDNDSQSGGSTPQPSDKKTDNNDAANSAGAEKVDKPEEENGSANGAESEKIDELSDEVDEIQKQIKELGDPSQPSGKKGTPFTLPEDQRAQAEVAARVEQIYAELRDMHAFDEVMAETSNAVRKEKIAQVKTNHVSNYAKGGNGGLSDFKLDLQRFIASQISYQRERTWERPDPRYKRRGYLVQGSATKKEENIPVINVYWDTSGSFYGKPEKTAAARAAIDTLQLYVKKGLIDIKVYYHSDDVYDHPVSGGNDGDAVVEHIRATHPDNIIVITDGDLGNTRKSVKVPGAAWFLFYDYTSKGLIDNVSGRKQTKWYMVKY